MRKCWNLNMKSLNTDPALLTASMLQKSLSRGGGREHLLGPFAVLKENISRSGVKTRYRQTPSTTIPRTPPHTLLFSSSSSQYTQVQLKDDNH